MQAWIAVGSAENFELLRERGFDLAAFKSSRRKQSSDMQPGDRIVFYLTKVVQFGGIAEITSEAFEDETDIGLRSESKGEVESFPYRVQTKPLVIPEPGAYVDVREITDLPRQDPQLRAEEARHGLPRQPAQDLGRRLPPDREPARGAGGRQLGRRPATSGGRVG